MPQIFDNIEKHLLVALSAALGFRNGRIFASATSTCADGGRVDWLVERWAGGDGHCCRLLVGMQQMPQDQLRAAMSLLPGEDEIDQATAIAPEAKARAGFPRPTDGRYSHKRR